MNRNWQSSVNEEKMKYRLLSSKLIRIFLVTTGTVSVVLGIIGIFLPLLPTTPFLLLAAYCYAKSSERFYNWLITNRICGKYIRNYREGLGMKLQHKLFVIILLWLTIGYSAIAVITNKWIKLVLIIIAISVTIHLIKLKTYVREQKEKNHK